MNISSPLAARAIPFNDGWFVHAAKDIVAAMADTTAPVEVRLPHDAVRDARTPAAESGPLTGYHTGGSFSYTKTFEVPAEWRERSVVLEFEGVYRSAQVFVNNVFAASHAFGYTGFTVPIDAFLKYGAPNTIKVDARSHRDTRWYSGAGIYRPVWLHVLDAVHVDLSGVVITTPDIEPDRARVEVRTTVVNTTRHTRTVRLTSAIVDAAGTEVALDTSPVTVLAGEKVTHVSGRLIVADPRLWSIDDPALYSVQTKLADDDGAVIDEQSTTFGIRSLHVDAAQGLRINGEEVLLRGACIHHDNGPLGAATIDRADERRVELLKAAGFNAIRTAHNPASRALLDAADRHGVVVLNEAFDVWNRGKAEFDYSLDFPRDWRADLTALVVSSRNHPSVIMYSVGNEILEIVDEHGAHLGRQLANFTRELDPTRYVTNALQLAWLIMETMSDSTSVLDMNTMLAQEGGEIMPPEMTDAISKRIEEYAGGLDIVGYNYGDFRYEVDLRDYPNRVMFGSETMPVKIGYLWELVKKYPHVLGDFTWVGWDYLGEVGIGSVIYSDDTETPASFVREYPYLSAEAGDLDITGVRKAISYYRETVFGLRRDPYIVVHPPHRYDLTVRHLGGWGFTDSVSSWSWAGWEGKPVRLEVYADADEVALLLDGAEIGREPVGVARRFQADFDTVWQPGELTAVGYRNGVETGRFSVASAVGDPELGVSVDRSEIRADDTDLAYVEIVIQDADGNLFSTDEREVSVEVSGAGALVGFGSGDPKAEERFDASTRTTFNGRALAIVRPSEAGEITVSVSAPGLATVIRTVVAG